MLSDDRHGDVARRHPCGEQYRSHVHALIDWRKVLHAYRRILSPPYDWRLLLEANKVAGSPHDIDILDAPVSGSTTGPRLTPRTAPLAADHKAACVFTNDDLGRETLSALADAGCRTIALRCAGFNNLDLDAARELDFRIGRVPVYSPHAVAFIIGRLVYAEASDDPAAPASTPMSLWRAAFPLVATVALLAVTRFEPLGLRDLLNATTRGAAVSLGPLGALSVPPALVVQLDDILHTGISWSIALLYVPFIIRFVVIVLVSAPLLRLSAGRTLGVAFGAARSLILPAIALFGALVFVKLMMHGGEDAPIIAIGRAVADAVASVYEPLWLGAAPLVGALGSFFSGSATVSNLTFGPVQAEIAHRIDLETRHILALQAVGAALGNMICVHNIVAVAAVLGLTRGMRPESPTPLQPAAQPTRAASSAEDPIATVLRMNALPLAAASLVAAIAATVLAMLQ